MVQPPSLIADLLDLLNEDLRYQFEERAGIMEFDGGLSRDYAECLALIDLLRSHPGALLGLSILLVGQKGQGGQLRLTLCCDPAAEQALRAKHRASHVTSADLAAAIKREFGGVAVLAAMD